MEFVNNSKLGCWTGSWRTSASSLHVGAQGIVHTRNYQLHSIFAWAAYLVCSTYHEGVARQKTCASTDIYFAISSKKERGCLCAWNFACRQYLAWDRPYQLYWPTCRLYHSVKQVLAVGLLIAQIRQKLQPIKGDRTPRSSQQPTQTVKLTGVYREQKSTALEIYLLVFRSTTGQTRRGWSDQHQLHTWWLLCMHQKVQKLLSTKKSPMWQQREVKTYADQPRYKYRKSKPQGCVKFWAPEQSS